MAPPGLPARFPDRDSALIYFDKPRFPVSVCVTVFNYRPVISWDIGIIYIFPKCFCFSAPPAVDETVFRMECVPWTDFECPPANPGGFQEYTAGRCHAIYADMPFHSSPWKVTSIERRAWAIFS